MTRRTTTFAALLGGTFTLLLATGAAALPAQSPTVAPDLTMNVSVTGRFADIDRPAQSGTIAGTVSLASTGRTNPDVLAFLQDGAAFTATGSEQFELTAACTTPAGQCPAPTEVRWDFGDGHTQLTTYATASVTHAYTTPGIFHVTTQVAAGGHASTTTTVAVSPRFVDVDAAYTGADHAVTKAGDASTATIWESTARGLLGPCVAYYTPTVGVAGDRPTDTGRPVFCTDPSSPYVRATVPVLDEQVAAGATWAPVNPFTRADSFPDAGAPFANVNDCYAAADNCALPAALFATYGQPAGSALASCNDEVCRTALAAAGWTVDGSAGAAVRYNPAVCADNIVAVRTSTGAALVPGVEPGCLTRGAFLTALGTDLASAGGATITAPACTTPDPTFNGSPAARALAVLGAGGGHFSACDLNAALTKGEAYRMLYALTKPVAAPVAFADLADRSLTGAGPAYTGPGDETSWAEQVAAVVAAGTPVVGSTTCPAVAASACFNPNEGLTRAHAAALLVAHG